MRYHFRVFSFFVNFCAELVTKLGTIFYYYNSETTNQMSETWNELFGEQFVVKSGEQFYSRD